MDWRDCENLPPQELKLFVRALLSRLQESNYPELPGLVAYAYAQARNADDQQGLPGPGASPGLGPLGTPAPPAVKAPCKSRFKIRKEINSRDLLQSIRGIVRLWSWRWPAGGLSLRKYSLKEQPLLCRRCKNTFSRGLAQITGVRTKACRHMNAAKIGVIPAPGRSLQPLLTADNAMTIQQITGGNSSDFSQQYSNALCVPVGTGSSYTFRNLRLRHSCEALMPGKSPRVRLMFIMLKTTGTCTEDLEIQGVISSEFLVTTSRAKGRGDGGALLYSSKVTFLPGVGLETERKLLALAESCPNMAGLVPPGGIQSVGQLGALLKELENKNDLRQHFKSVLKLDDLARWNKLLDAINSAVADDNRVRIFETKPSRADTDNLKLLFNAHQGQIVFEEKEAHGNSPPSIIGIIYRMAGANLVPTFVHVKDMTPQNLSHMHNLRMEAKAKWFCKGHPGWSISKWSAPSTIRQGCLIEAQHGDNPLQLQPLSKDPTADEPMPMFHYVVPPQAQQQYESHTQSPNQYPQGQAPTPAVRYRYMGNLN